MIELTMFFADIRGSSNLAESIGMEKIIDLIPGFQKPATAIIHQDRGMINRLMGDQVIGLFVPRSSGGNHAQAAIDASKDLLKVTGTKS